MLVLICQAATAMPSVVVKGPPHRVWAVSSRKGWRREEWEGLSPHQISAQWMQLLRQTSITCALEIGDFFYPAVGGYVRGMRATKDFKGGDEVCRLPLHTLLSKLSIAESSMAPMIQAAEAEADMEIGILELLTCFVLREGARRISRWMPYIQVQCRHRGLLCPACRLNCISAIVARLLNCMAVSVAVVIAPVALGVARYDHDID